MVAEPIARRVILASASPRRSDLLGQLGLEFVIAPTHIDETEHPGEHPVAYVRRVALEKAQAVSGCGDDIVIAADTTVDVDGTILAKPVDDDDARRMLRLLSGRAHRVHTGVAVRHGGRVVVDVGTTVVKMAPITDETMEWYIGTGEASGKAGGYAIQGEAAALIDGVQGSLSNVIGLPLGLLDQLMTSIGISLPALIAAQRDRAAD